MKKCPFCAEEIQDEAIYCRYCEQYLQTFQISTYGNINGSHKVEDWRKRYLFFCIMFPLYGWILGYIYTKKPSKRMAGIGMRKAAGTVLLIRIGLTVLCYLTIYSSEF